MIIQKQNIDQTIQVHFVTKRVFTMSYFHRFWSSKISFQLSAPSIFCPFSYFLKNHDQLGNFWNKNIFQLLTHIILKILTSPLWATIWPNCSLFVQRLYFFYKIWVWFGSDPHISAGKKCGSDLKFQIFFEHFWDTGTYLQYRASGG